MRDSFRELKDSKKGDEIYGIVDYMASMVIGLTYKHDGMSYTIEIPRTDNNDYLEIGDEVVMQILSDIEG